MDDECAKFFEKLDAVDCALFDFDGTLYPGNILLDLALSYFIPNPDEPDLEQKRMRLTKLVADRKKYSFLELSDEFAKLLEGVGKKDFFSPVSKFSKNIYPGAKRIVSYLRSEGKECYLVSLTAWETATYVCDILGLDGCFFRDLGGTEKGGAEFFPGRYPDDICDLAEFKRGAIAHFGLEDKTLLGAGDSMEDQLFLGGCDVRLLVNPDGKLRDSLDYDYLISDEKDPWECIANKLPDNP